jgi:hypothetical protein
LQTEVIVMEKKYWLGRQRAAIAMARAATDAEARLIHYDLAGRHGVRAAHRLPFMLPRAGPGSEGERAALQLDPAPALDATSDHRRALPDRSKRGPSARGH